MRTLYSEIEIKVSEPFISINETVGEASAVRCFAETPNHKN
jgi:U5 small nuclear ribonucleoprotein component